MSVKDDNGFHQAGPYLTLGWQMVITILMGVGIGYWIDKSYGTKPLYLVIFSVLFVIIALVNFIRTVLDLEKKENNKNKSE